MQDIVAFILVAILVVYAGVVAQQRIGGRLGQLVLIGFLLRILGSTLRLEVIELAYGGGSDAKAYFAFGREYADRMAHLDFHFFLGDENSPDPQWWGTQFIRSVSAVVIFFVGENIRAAFLVFSCFSFAGQALVVDAFGNAYGREHRHSFAQWVWLLPSLWFWPSSMGKEALITPALGLSVWGYVGRKGAPSWGVLAAGLALATAIRPHVAMVIALAIAIAELLRRRRTGGGARFLTVLALALIAGISIRMGLSQLGLGDADLEGIEEYFEHRSAKTEQGGSQIYRPKGPLAVPLALVNVFMRPFPWEARGLQILSGAEIWLFWIVLFRNRSGLAAGLRGWRQNRFTAVAAPLTLSLSLLYGLAFWNLGIIARQRIVVLPFLLSLVAIPKVVAAKARAEQNALPAAPNGGGVHRRRFAP